MQFVLSNAFREAKYVLIKINVYSRNHLVFIFFFFSSSAIVSEVVAIIIGVNFRHGNSCN